MSLARNNSPINSWQKFAKKVRAEGCNLLSDLGRFQDPVLVAGCQRSGTTAVANTISESVGMVNYIGKNDSELDAALILSGRITNNINGRFCFQTTYLNECVHEYLNYIGQYKVIWLVRNPHSVVYSMMYNWGNFAFNELFSACGVLDLDEDQENKFKKFGRFGFSKLEKACHSYNIKTSQALMLKDKLPKKDILIVEYDELINNANEKLKLIYDFINLPYDKNYSSKFKAASLSKFEKFSSKDKEFIKNKCIKKYEQVKALAI